MSKKQKEIPPDIWGYRLEKNRYKPIIPDEHGRLWIAPLHISLGPYQDDLAWFDANGNRLLKLAEEKQRANQERTRADEAEARANALEEELRRLRAELEMKE